jgi:diaminopimelate decarboxylase
VTELLELFPPGTRVDQQGRLWLGGCLASSLAQEFGTPLYVFDEATIRDRCRAYRRALARYYPGQVQVAYAGKAYLNLALAQLLALEGLSLDVVSGGELYVAVQAGFPAERIHFHGNNKSSAELVAALEAGVGRVVVDNFHELDLLEGLASERQACDELSQVVRMPIWLRLSPAVDVHTHDYRKTGLLDSKFGFPLQTDDAERALVRVVDSPSLELVGLHAHIGSQILETDPFAVAVSRLLDFAALMQAAHGFDLRELSPGGGWAVAHHEADSAVPIDRYVLTVCDAVLEGCRRHGLTLPTLVIEPGRSIIAPAAVALYRVGARKEIPGVRTYISVDGGMADNIRPALYGARYTVLAVEKADQPAEETVTIAGRFCESGDVLVRDISLPRLAAGDLLAVPAVGAYCLPMASNYNLAPRPAVVLVKEGKASLIQRRETYYDLVARDLPLPAGSTT